MSHYRSFSSCWHAVAGPRQLLRTDRGGVMNRSNPAGAQFRAARDELLALRTDYDRAVASFKWPQVESFNWALDWFDAELAQGSTANNAALRIVGDAAATRSFAELSRSSN